MRSSMSLALCFKWKDSTMATDTTAMYTENFRYDRKANVGKKSESKCYSRYQS